MQGIGLNPKLLFASEPPPPPKKKRRSLYCHQQEEYSYSFFWDGKVLKQIVLNPSPQTLNPKPQNPKTQNPSESWFLVGNQGQP